MRMFAVIELFENNDGDHAMRVPARVHTAPLHIQCE